MKKVMIHAYTFGNLGDDLFIQTLCNRYPDTTFVLHAPKMYKQHFAYIRNLNVIPNDNFITRLINYTGKKMNIQAWTQRFIASKCDAAVHIGGSLFIQNKQWENQLKNTTEMHIEGKPFFLLGANFGPFEDEEFLRAHKEIFQNYTDICFREKYTYELFQDLENVRLADDVIFQYKRQLPTRQSKELVCLTKTRQKRRSKQKTVLISVIKPSVRNDLRSFDDIYYEKMREIIKYFTEKDYHVILMSFCEYEGDNEAVQKIMERMTKTELQRTTAHHYQLNVGAALAIIAQAKFIIATRFHAMVLGWIYDKPVYPIVYSDKMRHVMNDIGFNGAYTDFEGISEVKPTDVFASINTNKIAVDEQVIGAERQFEKLDEYLA